MSIESSLAELFRDITSSSELIAKDRKAYLEQFPFLPPMLGLGDGRMLYLSNEGVQAIQKIAKLMRGNSSSLKATFSEKDMANLIANSIGELIKHENDASKSEIEVPNDTILFKAKLRDKITAKIAELQLTRTHVFGAWLFQGEPLPYLSVGPVQFFTRERWLQKSIEANLISEDVASQVSEHWKKTSVIDRKKQGRQIFGALDIIDAVSECPWICEVVIHGHSIDRSREKAFLAARIALSAFGLCWDQPSNMARETGLYKDLGPSYAWATLTYSGNRFVSSSRTRSHRSGRSLRGDDATGFLTQVGDRLQTVGSALDSFLSAEPKGKKPELEAALCRSLMWFGEGCREQLDFSSIVKFASALDTLANGNKAKGIAELIEKRLGIKNMKAPFLNDGTTARKLVEEIYETGRSRIVHGTRPTLVDDLDRIRGQAERLATYTLRACIDWLQHYSGADDLGAYRKC